MSEEKSYYLRYYNSIKGWENDKPRWYTVTISLVKYDGQYIGWERSQHVEMVTWIYDNIPKCEKRCRWNITSKCSMFKFRFEKDALLFRLRWE